MKATIISTVKDLPDWFKLENYSKARNFEYASDWHYELESRLKLRNAFNPENKSFDRQLDFQLWDKIKCYGLISHADLNEADKRILETLSQPLPPNGLPEIPSLNVNTLVNARAYGLIWYKKTRKEIVTNFASMSGDYAAGDTSVKKSFDWLWQPYSGWAFYNDKAAFVEVSLEASDEQLKNDFAKWLAWERKRKNLYSSKKNFSEADFTSWCESAVLPYMDLIFWAEIEGVRIQQHVIAQAIFPDAYALGSDVDPLGKLKTTKKKAETLLNEEVLRILYAQEG